MLAKHERIQKSAFINQKTNTPYLIARGDHRKIITVIKEFHFECRPLTAMARNNKYLLVRHGDLIADRPDH